MISDHLVVGFLLRWSCLNNFLPLIIYISFNRHANIRNFALSPARFASFVTQKAIFVPQNTFAVFHIAEKFINLLGRTQVHVQYVLYCGQPIIPGETLMIFDEIQECEEALNSLKYFRE